MANTQAMCTSFKVDLLNAVHAFSTSVPAHTASTADTFKAALYLASATVNATTTAYSATGEVTGTNYTAGGATVTFGTAPSSTSTTAFVTPSASITYSNVTLSTAFDAAKFPRIISTSSRPGAGSKYRKCSCRSSFDTPSHLCFYRLSALVGSGHIWWFGQGLIQ